MVLVWWPLPKCSWRLEGRLIGSVLVAIAGVHGGWRGPRVGSGLVATAEVSMETGGASSRFCSGGYCRCPRRLEGASSWFWSGGHCRSVHGDWRGVCLVLFWLPLPVSTEAGGGLGLVLVWWPLPKC